MSENTFGKEIKKKLIELGITQRKLAELLDMHESYLGDILSGRAPGFIHRKRIMDVILELEKDTNKND